MCNNIDKDNLGHAVCNITNNKIYDTYLYQKLDNIDFVMFPKFLLLLPPLRVMVLQSDIIKIMINITIILTIIIVVVDVIITIIMIMILIITW